MDENKKSDYTVATYHRRDVQSDSTPSYTSSLIVHLRQLHNDFQTQYQHEKHALNELNERLRHFVDRVQQLEAQNAQYTAQILNSRRSTSDYSAVDIEWSERYLHLQSELAAANFGSIDSGLAVEMYQLQAAIYKQLVEIEQQSNDDRRAKLEQEFNQTTATLKSLEASNSELGREMNTLQAARDDTYDKYLRLTQDWSRMKKHGKEWTLSIQMLKNQVTFYKNLRTHSTQGYTSTLVGTIDIKQFWASELDKVTKGIRRDFEQLYSKFHQDLTIYYNKQLEELNVELQHTSQSPTSELELYSTNVQALQVEYEKVQKMYSLEKDSYTNLESTYVKLESEFYSLQQQNDERLELQIKDLESLQENTLMAAYDVEEMRQRKIHLEGEIIVYRHLLDNYGVYEYTIPDPSPPSTGITLTRKFIVKSQKKGSMGIRECPPDGAYISLLNHSPDKVIDLSKWVIRRRVDGRGEVRYIIPDGVRLQPTSELRIYSLQGATNAKLSSRYRTGTAPVRQELVNDDTATWGSGNSTETSLFNQRGEEKAVFSQSIAVASNEI